MTYPRVSVVLSVRNGAADLPKAIDSILTQTFTDFELIAINNGSSDGTAAVLDRLHDPRYVSSTRTWVLLLRLIAASHWPGQYAARQDHDLAGPARLEKQVAFWRPARPALVRTRAEIWVEIKEQARIDHPTDKPVPEPCSITFRPQLDLAGKSALTLWVATRLISAAAARGLRAMVADCALLPGYNLPTFTIYRGCRTACREAIRLVSRVDPGESLAVLSGYIQRDIAALSQLSAGFRATPILIAYAERSESPPIVRERF